MNYLDERIGGRPGVRTFFVCDSLSNSSPVGRVVLRSVGLCWSSPVVTGRRGNRQRQKHDSVRNSPTLQSPLSVSLRQPQAHMHDFCWIPLI